MVDVFISYQRQERDAVQIVADKLRALKFDVWFDEALRAGGSFDAEIASNLKAAKAVLVCWTPAAIASEWVRAEAAMAHGEGRLLAAFLEPTELIPPFNLVHAENLMAWAGQEDDEAWLGLLARIGEMAGRPGVTSYYRTMRPEATVAELRAWAQANGADPLAEHVWERIALIEGEDGAGRLAREKAEARTRDLKRAENAARSKALAKARGLRDPKEQGRRMVRITAGVVVVGLLAAAGVGYSLYYSDHLRELDRTKTVEDVRAFLAKNTWGPIHAEGMKKFEEADLDNWAQIKSDGSINAYQEYIGNNSAEPKGRFLVQAEEAAKAGTDVFKAQAFLTRLRLYDGEVNGKLDQSTLDAITAFQYRAGFVVTGVVDDKTKAALASALADRLKTPFTEIPLGKVGRPSEEEFRSLAAQLKLDGPTLKTLFDVLAGASGFAADGSMVILYEPHIFSKLTDHRFDVSNPTISAPLWGQIPYPRTQAERWAQFADAAKLDRDAAFSAVSFGAFQILGRSYKEMGFQTPQEFVFFIAESEANQFLAVMRFIEARGLRKFLDAKDWKGFALGYYGGNANRYEERLSAAYARRKAEFTGLPPAPAPGPGQSAEDASAR